VKTLAGPSEKAAVTAAGAVRPARARASELRQLAIGNQAMVRRRAAGHAAASSPDATEVAAGEPSAAALQQAAEAGTRGAGSPLPYRDAIAAAFGKHSIAEVRAHRDAAAAAAAGFMNAPAYAFGDRIGFVGDPTLRTAAHEAAHVVQQRSGLRLDRHVGRPGDIHERNADAVADRVVSGGSAEALLNSYAPAKAGAAVPQLQRQKPDPSAQEKRVVFPISFTTAIPSKEAFIALCETTIYGRRVHHTWKNVKDSYRPSESPVMASVPASTLQGHLADFGPDVGGVIRGLDKVEDAATYQRLNRLIARLNPAQWADYASRVTEETQSLDEFERSIEAYLQSQRQRGAEALLRDKAIEKLWGHEALYDRYKDCTDLLGCGVAGVAKLNADLVAADFPGGIPDFKQSLDDYLRAFRTETARIGLDMMQHYESLLFKEGRRYENEAEVAALHAALEPMREEFAQFEVHAGNLERLQKADAEARRKAPPDFRHEPPSAAYKAEFEAELAAAKAHKGAAKAAMIAEADAFPILREEHLPDEEKLPKAVVRLDKVALAKADPAQLKRLLKAHIAARLADVKKTQETLRTDPDVVFSLDKLIAASIEQQKVQPESIFGKIVRDEIKARGRKDLIVGILTAVVAIVLGALSAGTGTVAVAAAGGGLLLGAGLAIQQFREFEVKDAAYGAGLLSEEPSLAWVVVAVVGAAIDLGVALKAARAISPWAKTLNAAVEGSADAGAALRRFNEGLAELQKAGKIEAKIAANVERAAAARVQAAEAASDLGKVLGSRLYAFPGPLADADVYRHVVRFAYYKIREVGLGFQQFALEMQQIRSAAKLGAFSEAENALLKGAYDDASVFVDELAKLPAKDAQFVQRLVDEGAVISGDAKVFVAKAKAAAGGDLSALGELEAAKALRAEGLEVHFRVAAGDVGVQRVRTSDLIVGGAARTGEGGVPYEVFTPITGNAGRIIGTIGSKISQADRVVIVLDNTSVAASDLSNILSRVNNIPNLSKPVQEAVIVKAGRVVARHQR
jgi:hypothetical protein